ncbi:MAG: electron transport complex subunit RsxC [Dehalococcoidia bacterium]|nr:electron transport complex subunit RsxC [Dehalococcoidia bacterium]
MDYTKFRLKPDREVREVLEQTNRMFVVSCGKCYKTFEREEGDEQYSHVLEVLGEDGSKAAGHLTIDFLCNEVLSEKKISGLDLSGCDSIGVISCGLGIQFVARLVDGMPVYALADSLPHSLNYPAEVGYHGISLEEEKCAACGQCYLNLTGGICPITNCAKALLNGPCGGATAGKCEVNSSVDCAWVRIYERLESRREPSASEYVPPRDHSRPSWKLENDLSLQNRMLRGEGFYGGVHPLEHKEATADRRIESFPEPRTAIIFLCQHAGKRARPLVEVGYRVKVGQKIGEADGFVSASIHSSISGKVVAIEERPYPAAPTNELAVVIENDGKNELDPGIQPREDFDELSKEALLEIIKQSGIVGLGGAMFPTHVKLSPPKPVDTLLVNGCECEPYLNADNRLMIEHPQEILAGLRIVQKILGVDRVLVGVEENKPEAIAALSGFAESSPSVEIVCLKTKYPQGAERALIKRLTGRVVPPPPRGLPFDTGVIVSNVATLFAVYQAVVKGLPLFQRVITVSGEGLTRPGNYLVKIGTPIRDIIEHCYGNNVDGLLEEYDVKMGGQIMGIPQANMDSSVVKGTTGLTVVRKYPVAVSEERDCIKCGRCVEVCPMQLYPLFYGYYGKKGELARAIEHKVEECVECGCCEFICAAKIALLSFIRQEKAYARSADKA